MLLILPLNQHLFGFYSEIFPALDLIIIYYISTYKKIKYWQLFIIGIFLDQLYALPAGLSSFALILAEKILRYYTKWLLLKEYTTNLTIFCAYTAFIMIIKYLIITILSPSHIDGMSILFYFITTILAYPIMHVILEKSINILGKNAG
jgi:cell shape-determining protein MreD